MHFNYNLPALLISMLITIARQASSMFARSCKRGITVSVEKVAVFCPPPIFNTVTRLTHTLPMQLLVAPTQTKNNFKKYKMHY